MQVLGYELSAGCRGVGEDEVQLAWESGAGDCANRPQEDLTGAAILRSSADLLARPLEATSASSSSSSSSSSSAASSYVLIDDYWGHGHVGTLQGVLAG
ncbi:hypothetical protein PSV08DRAFT_388764 [Bipolaris maydis]|nr:hypothetical protein J3E73DRAFT_374464 [Bipolaris maydis]KAJ6272305.1 hypothetical protein PSV08DRAFT_388764 [Bipolaris maydis]KAJ6281603.1 hypothetical protein J3E71DRAFT_342327 [Bipolaris maydis]